MPLDAWVGVGCLRCRLGYYLQRWLNGGWRYCFFFGLEELLDGDMEGERVCSSGVPHCSTGDALEGATTCMQAVYVHAESLRARTAFNGCMHPPAASIMMTHHVTVPQ